LTANGVGVPFPLNFTISNFENVTGTNFNDIITGDGQSNVLIGNAGNDRFITSRGNDRINGGQGTDTANYSTLGQVITLGPTGVVTKAAGLGTDTLFQVETIIASNLLGDTIDASTASATVTGIVANLTTNTLTANGVGVPFPLNFTVFNFENVTGTSFNDTITGDVQNNALIGGVGNDTLGGSAGLDTLTGGTGADTFGFYKLLDGVDLIRDFNQTQGDKIQISQVGFGLTSLNQITYNNINGGLFFSNTQFATLENRPSLFNALSDVVLV
jgi:Ca2+-binding RTX toxin-like protein